MNAMIEAQPQAMVPAQAATLLERAIEKGVDPDSLSKLVALQERILDRQAEQDFAAAMRQTQAAIQPVLKDRRNSQTDSNYATLEALNKAVVPVYTQYGFSLSFGTEDTRPKGTSALSATCSTSAAIRGATTSICRWTTPAWAARRTRRRSMLPARHSATGAGI